VARVINAILGEDLLVCELIFSLQPGEESGTDVKTEPLKVVQLYIGAIALLENTFVPVLVRRSPWFDGNDAS
jgi:hypothetical protein